jgi:GNAT superfamily N-acetyltransferase
MTVPHPIYIRKAIPSDADAIAAVHHASWEGSYRGIMPDEEFDKRPLSLRQTQWADYLAHPGRTTLVACNGDGAILGFASAWPLDRAQYPFDSYLATLYLRPDVKRRGIGRALLSAIAEELLNGGARSLVLRTLRLNPARQFYERLGARLVCHDAAPDRGRFDDVVYAFDDLNLLKT